MKIAVVSDTNGVLPEISGRYDLFVHCGNFCPPILGDHASILTQVTWLHDRFRRWLHSIDAEYKVIVPGFNDLAVNYLEPNFEYHIDAIYLRDQAATINGIVLYGTPWIPYELRKFVPSSASFVSRSPDMYRASLVGIPENVDILITRVPAYGILDNKDGKHIGSPALADKIETLENLKTHIFGFASDNGGQFVHRGEQLFANGCLGQLGYIEIENDIST